MFLHTNQQPCPPLLGGFGSAFYMNSITQVFLLFVLFYRWIVEYKYCTKDLATKNKYLYCIYISIYIFIYVQ